VQSLLGLYENFPEIIHGVARYAYGTSTKKVQHAIVAAFHRLNQENCGIEEIAYPSTPHCEVEFEFGVGEDLTFTFLDKSALDRLKAEIAKKSLMFLDFFCVLQYHIVDKMRGRSPLKFDYYFLRFAFGRNFVEFFVSHERGPQRVHVEDLIDFLTKHMAKELTDQYSGALKLENKRTV
jgi:hypothetical protein